MKHRNPEAMRRNAKAVIPDRFPLSATQIFKRQAFPRLPLAEVRKLCEELAAVGEVERIEIGFRTYYRRTVPRTKGLVLRRLPAYTPTRENEFFPLSTDVNWFLAALYPLKSGQAVFLHMDDPRPGRAKNYRGGKGKKLVVLVPGQAMGARADVVLVSVVGSGSCVIRPEFAQSETGRQKADLVLAGMPVKLATILMNELHQLYKEF